MKSSAGCDAAGSSVPLPLNGSLPPIRITRALTLRQPWAWAVAAGHKDVENRTWQTPHRGCMAIHAGGEWADAAAVARCTQLPDDAGVAVPPKQHLIRSAIVTVVFVEDCIAPDMPLESPWAQLLPLAAPGRGVAPHAGAVRRQPRGVEAQQGAVCGGGGAARLRTRC